MSTFPVSTSSPVVAVKGSTTKQDVIRNTVTFHASIWGDQFLIYDEKDDDLVVEKHLVDELIEEVRKKLMNTTSSHEPMEHMKLIQLVDAIQRLGVAYHFEKEIEEAYQVFKVVRSHSRI